MNIYTEAFSVRYLPLIYGETTVVSSISID